ncbi:MAG TPA: hypothetical protein VEK15_01790, partial [Vicinamibacteria bacterium]|nr:hypothetical protein [Vicinamibacteria bacterium]
MEKVWILGPEECLSETMRVLQDVGTVHLVEPTVESPRLSPVSLSAVEEREARALRAAIGDADRVTEILRPADPIPAPVEVLTRADLAWWARRIVRLRRRVQRVVAHRDGLVDEISLLLKYRDLFSTFESLFEERGAEAPERSTYCLVLKDARKAVVDRLRTSLREVAGEGLEMRSKPVSSGAAIVLSVPTSMAGSIETAFTR